MELTEAVKDLLVQTAKALKGSARRLFMARTVQALGEGGQRLAEQELGWNRGTIRKGMVLSIEPGVYWPGGGGLRVEDCFHITAGGNEKMCTYPDDFRVFSKSVG